jgi:hypothetical protein
MLLLALFGRGGGRGDGGGGVEGHKIKVLHPNLFCGMGWIHTVYLICKLELEQSVRS